MKPEKNVPIHHGNKYHSVLNAFMHIWWVDSSTLKI